jgi:hypothetical protein
MPVPEAAMNVDRGAIFWKHDIGSTGHVFAIEPKSITETVQQGAYEALWARVFRPYTRHVPASTLWTQAVHLGMRRLPVEKQG